jgi:hypothetical protein
VGFSVISGVLPAHSRYFHEKSLSLVANDSHLD